jgi:signal transduction histidine kinase
VSVSPAAVAAVAAIVALLRFGLYYAGDAPGDTVWLMFDLSMALLLAGWGALRVWAAPADGIGYLLQGAGLAWAVACLSEKGAVNPDAWVLLDSDWQLAAHLIARSLLIAAVVVVLPDRDADRFLRRGPVDAVIAGATVVPLVLVFLGPVSDQLRQTSFGFGNRAWIEVGRQVPMWLLFALFVVHVAAAGALAWTRRGLPPTSFQVIGWVLAAASLPLAVAPIEKRMTSDVLDLLRLFVFPALPVLSVISLSRAIAAGGRTVRELRLSQRRMVAAVEDERRRLRRELHDGLGPALAGVALGMRAAGAQVIEAKPETAEFLARLGDEVDTCVDEVRRIINDLRPPALDQLGLPGAIEAQARRLCDGADAPDLTVELDALRDVHVSASVELAAYRIVTEAVTNVIRHADARRCSVHGAVRGAHLVLVVEDDGRGMAVNHHAGVGLVSMRERAAAVGGDVSVGTGSRGGTRVRATLGMHAP